MERTPNLLGAWIYIMSHWIYFTSLIGSHKTELSISTDLEHFGYRHRYRNSGSLRYGVMQPELQLSLIQFLRFLCWYQSGYTANIWLYLYITGWLLYVCTVGTWVVVSTLHCIAMHFPCTYLLHFYHLPHLSPNQYVPEEHKQCVTWRKLLKIVKWSSRCLHNHIKVYF